MYECHFRVAIDRELCEVIAAAGDCALCVRYLNEGHGFADLYRPLWQLPDPMAVLPVVAFLMTSAWLGNLWIASTAIVRAARIYPHFYDARRASRSIGRWCIAPSLTYGWSMSDSDWTSRLREQAPEDWPAFLSERSGLPGPRANLALVASAAITARPDTAAILWEDGGEYTAMCSAAAFAYRAEDPAAETRARMCASDARWRVREGVALGLQLLGDENPDALVQIVKSWADDASPFVQRAAVAAICEPRLLREATIAAAALDACKRATGSYAELSATRRKEVDARSLRQVLAYCWSIVVAADPPEGMRAFSALDTGDRDLAWIVGQNRRKKRLARLL